MTLGRWSVRVVRSASIWVSLPSSVASRAPSALDPGTVTRAAITASICCRWRAIWPSMDFRRDPDVGRHGQDLDVFELLLDGPDVLGAPLGALSAIEKLTQDEHARNH